MKPASILGEWVIIAPCGRGNSGTVFKVAHVRNPKRIAALKLCPCAKGLTARRFCREAENARLVAKLAVGHVPQFICAGRWHGKPYYVMSYSDDLPMRLTKAETVRIICEIIRTCSTLLSFGLLHGDIKWENVGLEDGRVERAPRLHRRRIALAAGIWKTKIVSKRTALAVVMLLLAYWLIMTGIYLHQRSAARAKWGAAIDAAVKSRTGLVPVELNVPTNAVKIQSRQD